MSSEFLIWEYWGQNLAPAISFSGTAIAITMIISAPHYYKACQLWVLQAFLYTFQMPKFQSLKAFSALLGPINQSPWRSTRYKEVQLIPEQGSERSEKPSCLLLFIQSEDLIPICIQNITGDVNEATEKPTSNISCACFNRKQRSLWLWQSQRTTVMDSL